MKYSNENKKQKILKKCKLNNKKSEVIKTYMKKSLVTFAGNSINHISSGIKRLSCGARVALANQRGDFYISDAVKIIIAVVLGALLLAALTLIFDDTVIPRITSEIEGLFG